MPAYVEHEFPRGFILDEERLRKLSHIVAERLDPEKAGGKFHFQVYRGDAFTYTTNTIEDVLKEDNNDWRRLTKLEIKSIDGTDPHLVLAFASSAGTRVEIEGSSRDAVFLLFSDLREYLGEGVNTAPYVPRDFAESIGALVGIGMMALFLLYMNVHFMGMRPPLHETKAALVAPGDTAKLNYLIRKAELEARTPLPVGALLTLLSFFAIFMLEVPQRVIRFAFPSNVFLFGAQKARYEKRRRLLGKVIWVVLIGGAVSVLATVIAARVHVPWH